MQEWVQNLFPQKTLSRFLGWLASSKMGPLTHLAIQLFASHYQVNLQESQISNIKDFTSFNDFFTRALKVGARTIEVNDARILSPVDGAVSEIGAIDQDRLFQAKGKTFHLSSLCADQKVAQYFQSGNFLTAYLSPRDYHRFHMPFSGRLLEMIYVPGKLFSVNQSSVANVDNLFARNERVVCVFETALGKMAMIAVGAMVVGSVMMKWHGIVAPQAHNQLKRWDYSDKALCFSQGEDIGHFRLGSTIILLFEQDKVTWSNSLKADTPLRLGDVLGESQSPE